MVFYVAVCICLHTTRHFDFEFEFEFDSGRNYNGIVARLACRHIKLTKENKYSTVVDGGVSLGEREIRTSSEEETHKVTQGKQVNPWASFMQRLHETPLPILFYFTHSDDTSCIHWRRGAHYKSDPLMSRIRDAKIRRSPK